MDLPHVVPKQSGLVKPTILDQITLRLTLKLNHLLLLPTRSCGLRGKESTALQLGSGIWCFSETHLTLAYQRAHAWGNANWKVLGAGWGSSVTFLPER